MAGCAAPRWYPDAPENHLPLRLQRHVSDQLRCSKQSRLLRRALPILPPTALTATAHLQPLAQPTALRHPGFRCDIDSHPDCRPFLILIVAPQAVHRDDHLEGPTGHGVVAPLDPIDDPPSGSRRGGPPCHSGSHGRTTTRTKSTTCSAGSPDHRRELQAAGEATCWPQALGSAERHAAEGYDMSIRAAGPLGAAAPLTTVGLPLSPSEAAEASRYPTWRDWGAAGGFSGGSSRCRRGGQILDVA